MVEIDPVQWAEIYRLYREKKKQKPDHEFVLVVDEVNWIIHEVRTMRNYVTNFRAMMIRDHKDYDDWDQNSRVDRMTWNVRRMNNRVENYAVKNMLRLYDKYV